MSRRYSADHKALVLKILKAYKDDVIAASRYTGVPERTLREWRSEQRLAAMRHRAAMQQRKAPQRP
jgi:transposase